MNARTCAEWLVAVALGACGVNPVPTPLHSADVASAPDTGTGLAPAAADGARRGTPTDTPAAGPDCTCGDGACNLACEDAWKCPQDCKGRCGNGACEPGENPTTCRADCCGTCGDQKCVGGACGEATQGGVFWCAADCGTACGNKLCDPGETPLACPEDCKFKACGNGVCEGGEDPKACPGDCGATCGDCVCSKGETPVDCPVDCGSCGDGVCRCAPFGPGGATEAQLCPGDCAQQACLPGKDNAACSDANPCTLDSCDAKGGTCVWSPKDGAACDDGSACTHSDLCLKAQCGGTLVPCNDDSPCTAHSCDPKVGCVHLAHDGTSCDDKDACTAGETCKAKSCAGAAQPVVCQDANPCTGQACDPKAANSSSSIHSTPMSSATRAWTP